MSGLAGYSGPPLAGHMATVFGLLAGHGNQPLRVFDGRQATLAVQSRFGPARQQQRGEGLHEYSGDTAVALSGWLSDESLPRSTADLAEHWKREGPGMLASLHGGYVLAVADGGTLLLARDAAGLRTLFYAEHQGRLYFATQPKGVLAAPGFPRKLRPAAVAEYLTFSFVPGAATMLKGLHELPAGHYLLHQPGQPVQLKRYFRFEDAKTDHRKEPLQIDSCRKVLEKAVAQRLVDNEDPAVFLSGGLDSSIVAAEVARQSSRPVHTFSIHFGAQYPNELDFAQQVAQRCGTKHEEVLIQPRDFLPRLRQMVWHLDDAIGDPITMPNYELSAHVARNFQFAWNGEGGDPLFGGPKNLGMLLHHWYGGVPREANFRQRRYLESYRRGYEELSRLLTPGFREQIDFESNLTGILDPFFQSQRPALFLDKLMAINTRLKGAHLILPKVERMTGAWGLTPLSPMFDQRLVEFAFRLPPTMKLRAGVEKYILKEAYRDLLPATVIDRPKSGMRVPVHYWFRGDMRKYAAKLLSRRALKQAGIFDYQRVKQLLDYNTQEGPGRYGLRLWMLITFEIFRRIVIEGEPV